MAAGERTPEALEWLRSCQLSNAAYAPAGAVGRWAAGAADLDCPGCELLASQWRVVRAQPAGRDEDGTLHKSQWLCVLPWGADGLAGDEVYVAFKGSDSMLDVLMNACIADISTTTGTHVHAGAYITVQQELPAVHEAIAQAALSAGGALRRVVFTGHSLGGACAVAAALDLTAAAARPQWHARLAAGVVTFGAPFVVSDAKPGASMLQLPQPAASCLGEVTQTHFVNNFDIVPRLLALPREAVAEWAKEAAAAQVDAHVVGIPLVGKQVRAALRARSREVADALARELDPLRSFRACGRYIFTQSVELRPGAVGVPPGSAGPRRRTAVHEVPSAGPAAVNVPAEELLSYLPPLARHSPCAEALAAHPVASALSSRSLADHSICYAYYPAVRHLAAHARDWQRRSSLSSPVRARPAAPGHYNAVAAARLFRATEALAEELPQGVEDGRREAALLLCRAALSALGVDDVCPAVGELPLLEPAPTVVRWVPPRAAAPRFAAACGAACAGALAAAVVTVHTVWICPSCSRANSTASGECISCRRSRTTSCLPPGSRGGASPLPTESWVRVLNRLSYPVELRVERDGATDSGKRSPKTLPVSTPESTIVAVPKDGSASVSFSGLPATVVIEQQLAVGQRVRVRDPTGPKNDHCGTIAGFDGDGDPEVVFEDGMRGAFSRRRRQVEPVDAVRRPVCVQVVPEAEFIVLERSELLGCVVWTATLAVSLQQMGRAEGADLLLRPLLPPLPQPVSAVEPGRLSPQLSDAGVVLLHSLCRLCGDAAAVLGGISWCGERPYSPPADAVAAALAAAVISTFLAGKMVGWSSADSFVLCCGYNDNGQLGLNHCNIQDHFCSVPGLSATKVTCASGDTIALTNEGKLWATGRNKYGNLGLRHKRSVKLFCEVPFGRRVVQVSAGYHHTLALVDDGSLWATGRNANGELGLGHKNDRMQFSRVDLPHPGLRVITLVAGNAFSVAVVAQPEQDAANSTLLVWGDNDGGQLGTKDTEDRVQPTAVGLRGIGRAVQVSAGKSHTVLLTADGSVYAAGRNSYGCCGFGNDAPQAHFSKVGIPPCTRISCGYLHTLALSKEGHVYACGYNGSGELGLGHMQERHSFEIVDALRREGEVTTIAAGCYYSLVLLADGRVMGAGYNKVYNLGVARQTAVTSFVQLPALCGVARRLCPSRFNYNTFVIAGAATPPASSHVDLEAAAAEGSEEEEDGGGAAPAGAPAQVSDC
eukprot:TRINITY_DN55031_c0_g1_i1.p1 TRINITY_DN55031_c0_g1~~TRINITY_DN55031_c0_g1_i1.p1  ORF type:complete len:1228 (+),score=311.62 TRINITY_DN55031_c0_g1_i1:274-3957(+)